MRELPILMSTAMVQAILEGRKTQSRRVIVQQPPSDAYVFTRIVDSTDKSVVGKCSWMNMDAQASSDLFSVFCEPGDLLYVRETWNPGAWRDDGRVAIDYKASPELTHTPWIDVPEDKWEDLWIKWSDELGKSGLVPEQDGNYNWEPGKSPLRWKPSIHMPKWAARIWLRVTNVRVERVQEISFVDIQREGVIASDPHDLPMNWIDLWNSTYAKQGYGWDDNPWVWVIEFERVER
ncbi:hypothetical protein KQH61_06085 [bacterium]|nr:hypothetical protein [bacterium]